MIFVFGKFSMIIEPAFTIIYIYFEFSFVAYTDYYYYYLLKLMSYLLLLNKRLELIPSLMFMLQGLGHYLVWGCSPKEIVDYIKFCTT